MHALLVASADRIEHEGPMLDRIAEGLVDGGHAVTRVVPLPTEAGPVEDAAAPLRSERVFVAPLTGLPWVRRARARRLADGMERQRPDAIYASGTDAWAMGLDLARELDRPLIIELWSARQVRFVPRGRAAARVAAYLAPTATLARSLRNRVGQDLVGVAPIGVPLPPQPRSILERREQAVGLAVIGAGRDLDAVYAWLRGLAMALDDVPQLHAFMELSEVGHREVWRMLTRLKLHEQVSIIGSADRVRDLLVRCDALVMPELSGDARSLVLEAMAGGLPIVTRRDPLLEEMIPPEAAIVVESATAARWAAALTELVSNPQAARSSGLAGRRQVAAHHRPEDQIRAVLTTMERARTGGAFAFRPASD